MNNTTDNNTVWDTATVIRLCGTVLTPVETDAIIIAKDKKEDNA